MALRLLQPIGQPIGQFDALDADVALFKGGEVVMFTQVVLGADKAAQDALDGYSVISASKRPAVTKSITAGARPLFLVDEGTTGYGTMFGSIVGGTAGQNTAGTVVGPSTATGSGKATLWMAGLFAVSLDAVDTTSGTGLTLNNTSLTGGDALYVTSAGLLTPTVGSAVDSTVVARFIQFTDGNGLVATPSYLATATNGSLPSGSWTGGTRTLSWAEIYFMPSAV